MSVINRHGKKWTIPEVLSLQRDYELLNLSIEEIAKKHQRSENSILFKLYAEGLIEDLKFSPSIKLVLEEDEVKSDADSNYENVNVSECVECNMDKLSDRVWNLETSIGEINTMVKQMFDQMTTQKKSKKPKKLAPLRKM